VRPLTVHASGLALFLFIPLVLFLFVAHPEPVAASLAAGVALMLGHRLLARPFMERVRGSRCIWCARVLGPAAAREPVAVSDGSGGVALVACPRHAPPARRLFAWLDRARLPLRLGIALPLLALLAALAAAAAGETAPLPLATDLFRLAIGVTVNVAALGPWLGAPAAAARAAFPLHNFTLLGARQLLWVLRLVGVWWIVAGGAGLARALAG
jgi:hypothetical protein